MSARCLIVIACACVTATVVLGALPPLSNEHRLSWASHVLVGRVVGISSSIVERQAHFVDTVWDVELEVTEFEKGTFDATNVHASFWKVHTRPPAWTGDSGQRTELPSIGDQLRVFATLSETGVFDVLKPNGIEFIGQHKVPEPAPETPKELVNRLIRENKSVVFSKSYCPYCAKAKAAFRELDVPHLVVELDQRNDGSQIQAALRELTGRGTVPNVFVGGRSIGGGDDTVRMLRSGELRRLADA
eukprot:TRINITY_DN372_c0_g1_i1.p1 TRINITY_DN372_c0_g1~~TRINITY_DN372_c0_g1_i1.p1  ORF type:complete len:275 (+),score=85.53 TRINITY_DN372_c0_g1_i1:92-826(+)